MISVYKLKPQFQRLLSPVLDTLIRLRITPNQVTLFAMMLSVGYGVALVAAPQRAGLWIGLPLFFLLRMALNAIDGMLATRTGAQSRLGALLNEICDVVADIALYLPLAAVSGLSGILVVAFVIASVLTEFAGVLAVTVGAARRFDGPMGKSDRAVAVGALALMIASGVQPQWLNAALGVILLLALWTILNRLSRALRVSAPPTR